MRYLGNCPHCGARLEFTSTPPPLLACVSCAKSCMLVVSEEQTSTDEVQLVVLPAKERRALDGALERSGWRRPVLFAVIAACVLGAVFLALGVSYLVAPESAFTAALAAAATGASAVALLLTLTLLTTTLLALPVSWLLFGRRGMRAPEFSFGRSVLAIVAGVLTLLVASGSVQALRSLLHSLDAPHALQSSASVLGDIAAAVLGGLATVRRAPTAPYRHTAGVGLILVLCAGLLLLGPDGSRPPSPLGALAYLVFLLPLLLGAWLGVRLGWLRPRASPPTTC
jgi:hypothetical protein